MWRGGEGGDGVSHLELVNGTFRIPGLEWQYVTRHSHHRQSGVVGISVDTLLRWTCLPSFDLIKIDIEGAERSVLDMPDGGGRLRWLSRARYVYLEMHEDMAPGAERQSLDTLLLHNMSVFATFRVRRRFERVYLGCSKRVGAQACLAMCAQWRNDATHSPRWCRRVTDGAAALLL